MLAMKNRFGQVAGSVPGLAALANVSIADCEVALSKLSSPDPYSRSIEFEGRRIESIEGGWKILNHGKYRDAMSIDERRAYQAAWQKKHRAKQKAAKSADALTSSVDRIESMLTHADTDTDVQYPPTPPEGGNEGGSLPSSTKNKGAVRDSTEVWMLNQAIDEAKGPAKKSLKEKRLAVLSKHTGVDITKPPPSSPLVEASPPPSTDPAVASKLIADLKAAVRDTPAAPTKVHIVKSVRQPPTNP